MKRRPWTIVPMQLKPGGNDLVNHTLRHYVCTELPFDFGSSPPRHCPERADLRTGIEAAAPMASGMLQKVDAAVANDRTARARIHALRRPGKRVPRIDDESAKRLIRHQPSWWARQALKHAVIVAHDHGYAKRYVALIEHAARPGEDGSRWYRSPKSRTEQPQVVGRRTKAQQRAYLLDIRNTPLKPFDRHPGVLRFDIYRVHVDWDGQRDRLQVQSAFIDEGALARHPKHAMAPEARAAATARAQSGPKNFAAKLSARGGPRRRKK